MPEITERMTDELTDWVIVAYLQYIYVPKKVNSRRAETLHRLK